MHSRIVLLLGLLAVLDVPLSMRAAGDAPLDRATLKGLKSVSVIIDPLDPDLVKQGLTQEILQTRIEERLRDAGITLDKSATEFAGLRVMQVRASRGPTHCAFRWVCTNRFCWFEPRTSERRRKRGRWKRF